jgi:glycosyltransferase involved in cell wall biosynthesis
VSVSSEGGLERQLQVAVVGMSIDTSCGVRDYARVLAPGLAQEGVECSLHWLNREDLTLRGARAEVHAGMATVTQEIEERHVDAILLHYSVFSFAHRGFPLFAAPTLSMLRRQAPLLSVLHEAAYPWGMGGVRGAAWALSQRAALIQVVRQSAALLVTVEQRAGWLASRPWLPSRPIAVAPVFSTLPTLTPGRTEPLEATVGLFGYAHEGSRPAVVLDALRILRDDGIAARLSLLGSPGADSTAARRWQRAADARGVLDALSFTGTLEAKDLSEALGSCEVLLFADSPGPTSRKTTLAAMLASGRPVLAIDGPNSWVRLVQAGAALIVEPQPEDVARGLKQLMQDEQERSALSARGHSFYEETMSVEHSARTVAALLDQITESVTSPRRVSHAERAAS